MFRYLTFDLPGRRGEYDASEGIGLYLFLRSVSIYRPLPTHTSDWRRWYVYMMNTSIGGARVAVYACVLSTFMKTICPAH